MAIRGPGGCKILPRGWTIADASRQPSRRRANPLLPYAKGHTLEGHLDRKLNFPRRRGGPREYTWRGWPPGPIEDIRVVGCGGRRKVGVVENVEDLGAELHVEALRNSLERHVLEQREIQ